MQSAEIALRWSRARGQNGAGREGHLTGAPHDRQSGEGEPGRVRRQRSSLLAPRNGVQEGEGNDDADVRSWRLSVAPCGAAHLSTVERRWPDQCGCRAEGRPPEVNVVSRTPTHQKLHSHQRDASHAKDRADLGARPPQTAAVDGRRGEKWRDGQRARCQESEQALRCEDRDELHRQARQLVGERTSAEKSCRQGVLAMATGGAFGEAGEPGKSGSALSSSIGARRDGSVSRRKSRPITTARAVKAAEAKHESR